MNLLDKYRFSLPFNINKNIYLFNIKEAIKGEITIDFDVFLPTINKNLQRKHCWSDLKKQQLLLSILKGSRIPVLSIIRHKDKDGKETYQIIDGKQRLSTVLDFVNGIYPFIDDDGKSYFYKDLDEPTQKLFLYYAFDCDVTYSYHYKTIPDIVKAKWYDTINFAGEPQDEKHIKDILNKF
jgi:uncharacterized protein with ParB-like and HNH nuclease domain